MNRLAVLRFAVLVACGGAPETARTVVASPVSEPPGEDQRFASDVASPPPPKPMRQIDRDESSGAGKKLETKPEARHVDTTMGTGEEEAPHDAAMMIYSAHVTMAVYQVAPALDAIEAVARNVGGYLSSRNDTQIEIRVPRARFDEALKKVEASGDVLHRDVSALDVTDAYVDLEARLKNSRAVRDRLETLLQKAAVKEAIEIQRELERVTGEIESMEGKLKLLRSRVAYSTIDVAFQPRGQAALHDTPGLPFPWLEQLGLPHLLDFH